MDVFGLIMLVIVCFVLVPLFWIAILPQIGQYDEDDFDDVDEWDEFDALVDNFPEINTSNYSQADVEKLNNWAAEVVKSWQWLRENG